MAKCIDELFFGTCFQSPSAVSIVVGLFYWETMCLIFCSLFGHLWCGLFCIKSRSWTCVILFFSQVTQESQGHLPLSFTLPLFGVCKTFGPSGGTGRGLWTGVLHPPRTPASPALSSCGGGREHLSLVAVPCWPDCCSCAVGLHAGHRVLPTPSFVTIVVAVLGLCPPREF